jgi:type I restriction enzyme M protein
VITGELKSKIDRVWDSFWSGGISNPLEVIEQITYEFLLSKVASAGVNGQFRTPRHIIQLMVAMTAPQPRRRDL